MVLCRHKRWSIAGHCSLPPSWEGRRDDTDAQVVVGDLVHLAVAGPGGVWLCERRPKGLEARLAAEVGPATGISLLVVEALLCRSIGNILATDSQAVAAGGRPAADGAQGFARASLVYPMPRQ